MALSEKPRIGVSACLLGHTVRYDGSHRRSPFLTASLAQFVEWAPICPELQAGMGVPREPVRLIGTQSNPRMIGQHSATDWTTPMTDVAARFVEGTQKSPLCGFVFKKDSPSCGMERVRLYHGIGAPSKTGGGLFARALMQALPLLPAEEEGRLEDPELRENFIERVFALHRWQKLCAARKSIGLLVRFHTRHKFLLLAHSEPHYRRLGQLVASARQTSARHTYDSYEEIFMGALAVSATTKKHANVLAHMSGYISDTLDDEERRGLVALIGDYRLGLVPLIAPVTLVRHYIDKYRIGYLQSQIYFEPYPSELMRHNYR
jgi:uncharacterized protein YbgA (DUF1722 family)/uncharacterized protein YbbK (DUF523 family)